MTPVRCHPSSPYPLKPHERKDEPEMPSRDPPTTPGGDGSEILEDVPDYGFTNTRFQVLLGQASALGDDFDANTIWGPRPMPTAERAPSNTLAPNVIHAIDEGNGRDGDEAMESTDEAKAPAVVAVGLHMAQNEYRAFILTLNLGSCPMVAKVLGSLQQEDTCDSRALLQKLNGILPKEAIVGTAIKPIPIHLLP